MLLNLIKTYFDLGGHIQFNCVSSETLCDAQEHPQNYKNLVVRVAGFSSYFTRLYKGCAGRNHQAYGIPERLIPIPMEGAARLPAAPSNCSTRMKCMLEITIAPEVIAKFKGLLVEEDNEDAVFRIRETKVGGG